VTALARRTPLGLLEGAIKEIRDTTTNALGDVLG
jgi:hypothetical protein